MGCSMQYSLQKRDVLNETWSISFLWKTFERLRLCIHHGDAYPADRHGLRLRIGEATRHTED